MSMQGGGELIAAAAEEARKRKKVVLRWQFPKENSKQEPNDSVLMRGSWGTGKNDGTVKQVPMRP